MYVCIMYTCMYVYVFMFMCVSILCMYVCVCLCTNAVHTYVLSIVYQQRTLTGWCLQFAVCESRTECQSTQITFSIPSDRL